MIYGKPKGLCPVCGRLIKLRRDGTIGHHGSKEKHIWSPASCRGWTQPPKDPFS